MSVMRARACTGESKKPFAGRLEDQGYSSGEALRGIRLHGMISAAMMDSSSRQFNEQRLRHSLAFRKFIGVLKILRNSEIACGILVCHRCLGILLFRVNRTSEARRVYALPIGGAKWRSRLRLNGRQAGCTHTHSNRKSSRRRQHVAVSPTSIRDIKTPLMP